MLSMLHLLHLTTTQCHNCPYITAKEIKALTRSGKLGKFSQAYTRWCMVESEAESDGPILEAILKINTPC